MANLWSPSVRRVEWSFTQAPALGLPSYEENIMARKYIDCREFPSESKCSVALSADSENELLEVAVQHAVTGHKYTDTPELRSQLKGMFHDGTPPVEAPRQA
jgi:predicted small metal-binding protein